MNIVFLDVDGELTYSDYYNEETANIDIEKVKLLKEICDKTDAKVVISSSWRGWEGHTPRIYHTLIDILTSNNIEVLGDTPHLPTEFENRDELPEVLSMDDMTKLKLKYGTGRAAEIQKWISEHDVDNFVILDDENFDWSDYGYDKNWVQPTWFGDGGLQQEHVDRAIEILRGEMNDNS